jgi:signal transduction histidine kinase
VTGPLGAARACLWLQAPQPGSQFRRVPARGRTPALLAQEPPAGPVPSASPWHPGGTGLGRLFPLQAAGSVSGVLAVAWGREESPEEIAAASPILASYATHLALALANAVLLEETERLGALMERQRLARELHDAVSQTLFSSTLTLATAERLVADGSAEGPLVLSQARGQVQRALAEMRAMIYELAPPDDDSLASALRRLAAEAGGLVTLEHSAPEPAHFEVRAALRRIAQEAVQNALRHAPGRPVRVVCTGAEDRMTLTVSDDGPGFAPDSPSAGLGMRHMRDRAAAIGAHLSVLTAPGGGTTIRVEWSESHPRAGGREVLS